MSKFSVDAFMANLPDVILEDEHLRQLAEIAARVMYKCLQDPRKAAIYCRIDELDEGVLDILADDLKIDWYDYNASLEVKRRTVKDSWYVHRRMGTVEAVEKALGDEWPNSIVDEWFNYGGDPFHFRIVLDASDPSTPIHIDPALDKVRLFKPARASLDDSEPIIRVCCNIVVNTARYNQKYHVIASGMRPTRAVHGERDGSGIVLDSGGLTSSYRVRPCGTPLHALM